MPPRSNTKVPGPSEHSLLLHIARRGHYFLTPEGQPHVTIPLSGNTVPLYSPIFRDWLSLAFEERGFLPSSSQYGAIMRQLEEDAHTAIESSPVHLRTTYDGMHTYRIDLDNATNEAIQVNGKQWTTIENDHCRFRRTATSLPLPLPEANGAPIQNFLMRMFSIKEPQAQMLVTWLVSATLPNLKSPVLVITGKEARDAASKLRSIIDPVRCPINVLPTTENQFGQLALVNRIPTFSIGTRLTANCIDNLNKLRIGMDVKLKQIGKQREEIHAPVHRPIIIAALAHIEIHEEQLNIEINETCSTLPQQILASLMDAVVRGIHEMSRQPKQEYFIADEVRTMPPEQPQPPSPFT